MAENFVLQIYEPTHIQSSPFALSKTESDLRHFSSQLSLGTSPFSDSDSSTRSWWPLHFEAAVSSRSVPPLFLLLFRIPSLPLHLWEAKQTSRSMQFGDDIVWIPRLGMEFQTADEAWLFWKNYSGKMGFSIRKRYGHNSRVDGSITSKVYVCANEGVRAKDKRDEKIQNPRAQTRTNCQVRLGIKFIKEKSCFEVVNFISDHNHLLQKPEACHLLRSQREIPEAAMYDIELADETGVRPRLSHELMGRQVGGSACLTFSYTDHKNAIRDMRQKVLISGEAVAMLNYFHERVSENPSFQHVEQLDEMQEITNIIWADAKMIADYARFGEVVVFYTTFGTNKEHRPFGVFVGFNQFREMLIFGATIMYDQKIESFEWVFKTFTEVHNHKKPKTIFTDQDIAMGIAIEKVMPETTHGLCTWHIMENASKHLMTHNKKGLNILEEFSDCMYVYEEVEVFEKVFADLMEKISEEEWLPFIYKYKKKWAYCYMKDAFSLGIRSTQLSESINRDLKMYLKSDLSIIRLLKFFETIVSQKRENEITSDFDSRWKQPKIKVNVPILQQAGSFYTPKIFELFQAEYELAMASQVEGPFGNEYMITIPNFGNYEISHKGHRVFWNNDNLTLSCGCKKFERIGILCWHALKVLDAVNIKVLPEKYILKRWTREAQDGIVEDRNGRIVIEDTRLDIANRNRNMCRQFSNISAIAARDEESTALVCSVLNTLEKQLEEQRNNLTVKTVQNQEVSPLPSSVENFDQNQLQLKKKEDKKTSKMRKTSWVEKLRKEGGGTKQRTKSKENNVKRLNSDVLAVKEMPQTDPNYHDSYVQLMMECTNSVSPSPHCLEVIPSNQGANMNLDSHIPAKQSRDGIDASDHWKI